jgi:hypothetical protein
MAYTTEVDNGEFVFLDENAKDVQKKLNQWRHDYYLKLHGVTFTSVGSMACTERTNMAVMVERTKKQTEPC